MNVNKLIILAYIFSTINLYAQQDSALISLIPTLKENEFQQRKEIAKLKKNTKKQSYAFSKQKKSIAAFLTKNTILKETADSLS